MSVNNPALRKNLSIEASGSHATGWWGMVLLILTEAAMFATLIASYFFLRFNVPKWPPTGIDPPQLTLPIIATIVLVGSSLPMYWADSGMKQGQVSRMRLGLAIAFILALIFLGLQAYEYTHEKFGPQTTTYGSLFFTIIGIHGLHVLIALIINAVVQIRAALGHFTATRRLAVENVALYWHFVNVVWIFIFASLYISPYLF